MSHYHYQILDDAETLTAVAAETLANVFRDSVREHGKFYLALSGGSTPKQLYQYLVRHYDDLPWSDAEIFFGDERCVPPDDSQSNFRMASESMLDELPIPASQIHRIEGELAPEVAASHYQETLKALPSNAADFPIFDLVLLGMGPDGHTASLFPESDLINESQQTVGTDYIEKMGNWRISLTFPVINAARHRLVLVGGEEKAPVIDNLMLSQWPDTRYPIARVTEDNTLWLLQANAAQSLPRQNK